MIRIGIEVAQVSGALRIAGEQAHYLCHVMRVRPGEQIVLFSATQGETIWQVAGADRDSVRLEFVAAMAGGAEPQRQIVLIAGLSKGQKPDEIVRQATALGASEIRFFEAKRSVPAAGRGREQRWRRIAGEAVRQCGRTNSPHVSETCPDLATALDGLSQGVVFHPGVTASWQDRLAVDGPLALVTGPEGGLTDEEVDLCMEKGLVLAGLGPRVLRTELACLAALVLVGQALGEYDRSVNADNVELETE